MAIVHGVVKGAKMNQRLSTHTDSIWERMKRWKEEGNNDCFQTTESVVVVKEKKS